MQALNNYNSMNKDDYILEIGKNVLKSAAANIQNTQRLLDESFISAVKLLYITKGNIILSGIGKSGIIAKKIAATLSSTGTFSIYIHPSEAFHGDFGMINSKDTLIIFSHSGETKELLDFLRIEKKLNPKNKIIVITSKENSTISNYADITLLTHVTVENGDEDLRLIPTTSTTVTIALGDALAIALQKLKGFKIDHLFKNHPGGQIGKLRNSINKE